MGRLLKNSTSSNALSASAIAFDDVVAGRIAVMRNDGRVTWAADPDSPGATLRPVMSDADVVNGLQSNPNLFAVGIRGRIDCVKLQNGNFVVVSNDINLPFTVRARIFDPHGVLVTTIAIGPSSGASNCGPSMVAIDVLSNGSFVVVYNKDGAPMFAIYDAVGTLIKAPTAIDAAATMYSINVAALKNGHFAVGYNIFSTFEVPKFAVFSATGDVVKAATVLRAPLASNASAYASSICALAGGGFVCAYSINVTGTHTNYFQRFDNSGVAQGSEIVVRAGAAISSGVLVSPCSGGGFVVMETDGVRLNFYSASGASSGLTIILSAGAIVNNSTIATHANADGGLLVWSNGVVVKSMLFNSAGGATHVDTATSDAANAQIIALLDLSGNVVVGYSANGGKLAVKTYTNTLTPIATTVYSNISSDVAASDLIGCGAFLTSPLNPSAMTFALAMPSANGNATLAIINSFVAKVRPVGVFISSALAGGSATYQWAGQASLQSAFKKQIEFATFPQGQKMAILGKTVLMYGVTG